WTVQLPSVLSCAVWVSVFLKQQAVFDEPDGSSATSFPSARSIDETHLPGQKKHPAEFPRYRSMRQRGQGYTVRKNCCCETRLESAGLPESEGETWITLG